MPVPLKGDGLVKIMYRNSKLGLKGRQDIAGGEAPWKDDKKIQAPKGRYWGQNNGSFGITPFQGLLVFPCPQGVALG